METLLKKKQNKNKKHSTQQNKNKNKKQIPSSSNFIVGTACPSYFAVGVGQSPSSSQSPFHCVYVHRAGTPPCLAPIFYYQYQQHPSLCLCEELREGGRRGRKKSKGTEHCDVSPHSPPTPKLKQQKTKHNSHLPFLNSFLSFSTFFPCTMANTAIIINTHNIKHHSFLFKFQKYSSLPISARELLSPPNRNLFGGKAVLPSSLESIIISPSSGQY